MRYFFSPGSSRCRPAAPPAPASGWRDRDPTPGEQATRQLTVTAADGRAEVEAVATFIQVSAAEVPMSLRVEPTLVRVRDGAAGLLDISIDNRRGSRTRRVFLGGRDSERVVQFAFSPPSIDVLAGEVGRGPAQGRGTATAAGAGVQPGDDRAGVVGGSDRPRRRRRPSSRPPPRRRWRCRWYCGSIPAWSGSGTPRSANSKRSSTTAAAARVRRVFLTGRDPERLVRFTFSPPSLDVLPGDIGRARVRLEAPLPEPGQEATRQVTVVAADGNKEIEASGTFVQVTSPKPVETPVALKLEPSLLRVRDNPSGQFQVIVDNRQGIRPRRVTLAGTDPERALGFSFWPPVVEVGQGQIARSNGQGRRLPT